MDRTLSRPPLLAAFAAALLALVPAFATAGDTDANVRSLDLKHSSATFEVTHLYVSSVTGTLPVIAGSLTFDAGSTVPVRVEATLDPKRIKTGEDERDGELQDGEWFDTAHFPTWTYSSTKVTPGAAGAFTVEGILTVHGTAQPVTLAVTTVRGLPSPAYHAVGHADRHGFGMAKTRQDGLVGTDITITLDAVVAAPNGG
jgi:polyisoprenoid-binding protein YceI